MDKTAFAVFNCFYQQPIASLNRRYFLILIRLQAMKKIFVKLVTILPLSLGLLAMQASAAATEQLVSLVKPNGTALRYLLTTDPAITPAPETGVILFSGAQGQVNLAAGIPQPGSNFLVRTRQLFAQDGLAVAVYDPSPDIGALSDHARMSRVHADEVAQVLADLKQKTGVKKIYLVGTSRGTISAAYLSVTLKNEVDGVVLTSTLFQSSKAGPGLSGFDFSTISQPLLFVHHVSDSCKYTSPGHAKALSGKYPVIWVEGTEGAQGDSCGPFSAHGYLGREQATVRAIADWILYRKLTPKIDAANPTSPLQ
jgi:pimeloyl-ACP methyl ester carboxylesterase